MESFFRVKDAKIDVVYNGIDTSRYNQKMRYELREPLRRQLGISADEVVFLFISYDLKKKGIEPLIGAVFQLKKTGNTNFKVMVVGGWPYRDLLRQMSAFSIQDKILFTGPVRSTKEYYANSVVFVLPTYYDACSLVVIEAMASGLPSITTTANGAAGIITDGKDGYVIPHPPGSPDLAKKMQLLLDDENRQKMSREALRTGRSYSEEKNHQKMMRILGEAAAWKGNSYQ